jgi:hypothetical protein
MDARIARYLDETKGFKPARHELADDERQEIERRCEAMMRRYGYVPKPRPA